MTWMCNNPQRLFQQREESPKDKTARLDFSR